MVAPLASSWMRGCAPGRSMISLGMFDSNQ
jgi:hypothetical protein